MIEKHDGAVINLVAGNEQTEALTNFQKKMEKAFNKNDILKCIPIMWHEVAKTKGRVEQVLGSLSNKRVRDEKLLEFKKQILSNKSLKEYFKNNPSEKQIL